MKIPSEIPIQYIKGVGPSKAQLLKELGILTVEDILYYFPRRHEDRSRFVTINQLKIGEYQTVFGEVLARGQRKSRFTQKRIFETSLADQTGQIACVWFNQPYLEKYFKPGSKVVLYGRVDVFKNRIQMIAPEYEIVDHNEESLNINRIVPIYGLTKGISQRFLRKIIFSCIQQYGHALRDVLPEALRKRYNFTHITQSVRAIHFPDNFDEQTQAHQRVSFEEFFLFQISVILRRMSIVEKNGYAHNIDHNLRTKYETMFDFPLTQAQKQAIDDVIRDMKKNKPMLRLLQGDVGSGKTLVSFFGCLASFNNRFQSAIMAPTEILAHQHYTNFKRFILDRGFSSIRLALLVSSQSKREKEKILDQLKDGNLDVVIGTHALLQETVVFKKLSFVVIDEQHKFGVKQRALLTSKGNNPDVLVMTATPIPRTLCLTLYGDLDVSVINEKPPGRGFVKTYHFLTEQSPQVYERVRQWVKKGTQAYIVYPIVEESEKLDLKAATDMYEYFVNHEFKDLRVGLLHGQMNKADIQAVMELFKSQQLDILVTTTVLEVGVDVANANVMVIEHAQRFGLSQLHQLRGRIGRSQKNAVCVLLTDQLTPEGQRRIQAFTSTTDGFKIAQEDLKIRGPGHYFGQHQHGLNELRMANSLTQIHLLEQARKEAVEMLNVDPKLKDPEHVRIVQLIQKRYPEYLSLVFAA